jgi:hypothetical protein
MNGKQIIINNNNDITDRFAGSARARNCWIAHFFLRERKILNKVLIMCCDVVILILCSMAMRYCIFFLPVVRAEFTLHYSL